MGSFPSSSQFSWIQQTVCAGTDDPGSESFCEGYTSTPTVAPIVCTQPTTRVVITTAPTQMPVTPAPTPTSCSETVIKVKILADDYGSETTWDLIDQRDGELVRSGGPYNPNQEVEDEFCISAAQ